MEEVEEEGAMCGMVKWRGECLMNLSSGLRGCKNEVFDEVDCKIRLGTWRKNIYCAMCNE